MNEIEEVKARLDVVDVIGQYVQLQKAGRTYKANCPFHTEKTPSFIVSPDRQSWHCFGACGTGGDVISFVMRREGLDFPEALRILAERAGVRLQDRRRSQDEDKARERLYATNEAAAQWFQSQLADKPGRQAAEYLERRGIDEAVAQRFLLGYSLPSWEAAREHLRGKGFEDRDLLAAGLVVQGDNGLHDRFRGRLMFPIWDAKARIAGFGARALDDSLPKYLNTAQTALFDKGGLLYLLHRSQEAVRAEGRAVIVEGYMDAIAAHQLGFENVVASMGTALTERQVRLLKRLTREIVLALDADAAGSEAAVRGHDVVRETVDAGDRAVPVVTWRGLVRYQETTSVDLRVAVLPEGKDPDDVIRGDPDGWRALVSEAQPVLEYRLAATAASLDLADPRGRSQLAREFLPLLSAVADPVVRAHYLQRLSRLTQTGEQELTAMLRQLGRPDKRNDRPAARPPLAAAQGDAREEFLLSLLLRYPQLRPLGLEVPRELLWDTRSQQVFSEWRNLEEPEELKNALPVELQDHLERLQQRKMPPFDEKEAREALLDCRRRLERRQMETQKQAIGALIAAGEEEIGASVAAEATVSAPGDERVKEVVDLYKRDMEAGRKLHRIQVEPEGATEAKIDG